MVHNLRRFVRWICRSANNALYYATMKRYLLGYSLGLVMTITAFTGCGTTNPTTSTNTTPVYSLTDISSHATAEDCWMAIEQKVYDVTAFIPQHPGETRILDGCGRDATDLFTGKDPMGRVHSAVAKALLAEYYIGDLAL